MSNPNPVPGTWASDWLALCLITEDNEPHAWPYLAEVINNRTLSPRYPDNWRGVVLQPHQFSRFNDLSEDLRERGTLPDVVHALKIDMSQFAHARKSVEYFLQRPHPLFSRRVLFFYAPGSMTNEAKVPKWWKKEVANTIIIPQLTRWVFGEVAR